MKRADTLRAMERALSSAMPFIEELSGAGNKYATATLKKMRAALHAAAKKRKESKDG